MKFTEVTKLASKGVKQTDKPDIETDMEILMEYDRAIMAVRRWMVEVLKLKLDSCPELEDEC